MIHAWQRSMHEVSKMKDKQFVFNDFKISNFGEELLSSFFIFDIWKLC